MALKVPVHGGAAIIWLNISSCRNVPGSTHQTAFLAEGCPKSMKCGGRKALINWGDAIFFPRPINRDGLENTIDQKGKTWSSRVKQR